MERANHGELQLWFRFSLFCRGCVLKTSPARQRDSKKRHSNGLFGEWSIAKIFVSKRCPHLVGDSGRRICLDHKVARNLVILVTPDKALPGQCVMFWNFCWPQACILLDISWGKLCRLPNNTSRGMRWWQQLLGWLHATSRQRFQVSVFPRHFFWGV